MLGPKGTLYFKNIPETVGEPGVVDALLPPVEPDPVGLEVGRGAHRRLGDHPLMKSAKCSEL